LQLARAFGQVVEEENIDGSLLISEKIKELAREIEERGEL